MIFDVLGHTDKFYTSIGVKWVICAVRTPLITFIIGVDSNILPNPQINLVYKNGPYLSPSLNIHTYVHIGIFPNFSLFLVIPLKSGRYGFNNVFSVLSSSSQFFRENFSINIFNSFLTPFQDIVRIPWSQSRNSTGASHPVWRAQMCMVDARPWHWSQLVNTRDLVGCFTGGCGGGKPKISKQQ